MLLTLRRVGLLAAALLAIHAPASAQLRTGHAIPGFHGLESSVPPPLGLSYENATVVYYSSLQRDRHGHESSTISGDITHVSNHSTLTWGSPWIILGANWVMRVRIPIANSENHPFATSLSTTGFNVGDLLVEPISLYWEGNRYHVHLGYGYWLDTGEFDYASNDNHGKGFASHQATLGVTAYTSSRRDWHISMLARYELHDSIDGADLIPGQNITVDWAVGKHLSERWNAGLVGYGVWQTSSERGEDGNGDQGFYGTAGVGGEVRYAMPDWRGDIRLRAIYEVNAYNRPEGTMLFLGLNFGL